jgi:ribosomal subunit interface protein
MEMNVKISFHNMPHSEPMEQHAREKLQKLLEYLKDQKNMTPLSVEMWLKANKQHPHHAVEINLKSRTLTLHAHHEGPDLYLAIDTAIDKMITQLIKEKERMIEKNHKPETDKTKFSR